MVARGLENSRLHVIIFAYTDNQKKSIFDKFSNQKNLNILSPEDFKIADGLGINLSILNSILSGKIEFRTTDDEIFATSHGLVDEETKVSYSYSIKFSRLLKMRQFEMDKKQEIILGVVTEVNGDISKIGMYNISNDDNILFNGELLSGLKVGAFVIVKQGLSRIVAKISPKKLLTPKIH